VNSVTKALSMSILQKMVRIPFLKERGKERALASC